MISFLSELPSYTWVNITLLLSAALICVMLWLIAAAVRTVSRLGSAPLLPRISRFAGSSFPTLADEFYTLLFLLFYAYLVLCSIGATPSQESDAAGMWYVNFINILIYLPFALRYLSLPPAEAGWNRRHLRFTLLALVCIYAFSILLNICRVDAWLMNLTGTPDKQDITNMIASETEPASLVALCFGSIVIAPIMEEFAFRGFLYNILRQRAGIVAACIASSLFFAAIHMALVQTLPLFGFAIAQCILYEKTRSLRYCIVLHVLFNSISTAYILTSAG